MSGFIGQTAKALTNPSVELRGPARDMWPSTARLAAQLPASSGAWSSGPREPCLFGSGVAAQYRPQCYGEVSGLAEVAHLRLEQVG